jgi:hypothetical protein
LRGEKELEKRIDPCGEKVLGGLRRGFGPVE